MEDKVLVILFYFSRFFMALVGAYICWMWGYGIDNAIFIGLGYFLALMFLNLEGNDQMFFLGKLYSGTLLALPLSYVFLSLFYGTIGDGLCQESSKYCAMHLIN